MGVCTGFGGGLGLVKLVGYSRALDLLMSGRRLGLEEGLRIGFFDAEIETGKDIREEGLSWLQQRTQYCTPQIIKNTKAIVNLRQEDRGMFSNISFNYLLGGLKLRRFLMPGGRTGF